MFRKLLVSLAEIVEVAVIALVAVFLIRSYLVQPFLVSGNSMVPTFKNGDYLLIDELSYHFRTPYRGEVTVFRYPQNESTFFIKRIIGLPGERVKIQDNVITVYNEEFPNGKIITEAYLGDNLITSGSTDVQMKVGEYFVLGDNRLFSYDSRNWGILPKRDIVGLVRLRLWPPRSIEAFAAPAYQ
ncbi:MAG: signal peptidase I [Patescibacteria group bacterium]